MKDSTKGAIALVVILILAGYFFIRFFQPQLLEKGLRKGSDAKQNVEKISGKYDDYLGYWPNNSPEARRIFDSVGLQNVCIPDRLVDYDLRFKELSEGKIDYVFAPINSYLEHGRKYGFPGLIVAPNSASIGADGWVAFKDKIPSGKVKDLNDASLRFVYPPKSPTTFLLDIAIQTLELDQLRNSNSWRYKECEGGAQEVLEYLKRGDGDVFGLWEPYLSQALQMPGVALVWSSADCKNFIKDVFIFNRDYLDKHETIVTRYMTGYYQTVQIYLNNKSRMLSEMNRQTGIKEELLVKMVPELDYYDLRRACSEEMGIPLSTGAQFADGVFNTISACVDVMIRAGTLDKDPLNGLYNSIIKRGVLESVLKNQPVVGGTTVKQVAYNPISAGDWAGMVEVATLRVEDITFTSWKKTLDYDGEQSVAKMARLLINNYPQYRMIIRAHTPAGGDEMVNIQNSQQRADIVMQAFVNLGISPNRMKAEGVGSNSAYLPRRGQTENDREYYNRLTRVTINLVEPRK